MTDKITFKFKKGISGGSVPSGLTHGELAVNTTDKVIFVGTVTGGSEPFFNRTFIGLTANPEGTWYPNRGDRWWAGIPRGQEKMWNGSSWLPIASNNGLSGVVITGASLSGNTLMYGGMTVNGKLSVESMFIAKDITKGPTGITLTSFRPNFHGLRIETPGGWVSLGPLNASYSHFLTDRSYFYFDKPFEFQYGLGAGIDTLLGSYDANSSFSITTPINSNGTIANRITVLTGPDGRAGGFVGIGTENPQEKLDVNGNAIVRGSINVTGGATITGGLNAYGNTMLANGLSVTGGATITGGLNAYGNTMLANGLSVTGGATITGGLTAYGNTVLYGDVTIDGTYPFIVSGGELSPIMVTQQYNFAAGGTSLTIYDINASSLQADRWYNYEITYNRTQATVNRQALGIRILVPDGITSCFELQPSAFKPYGSPITIEQFSIDSTISLVYSFSGMSIQPITIPPNFRRTVSFFLTPEHTHEEAYFTKQVGSFSILYRLMRLSS